MIGLSQKGFTQCNVSQVTFLRLQASQIKNLNGFLKFATAFNHMFPHKRSTQLMLLMKLQKVNILPVKFIILNPPVRYLLKLKIPINKTNTIQ